MKNFYLKDKSVYDFMIQWFTDAMTNIERNPNHYELHICTEETNYGYRNTITITDLRSKKSGKAICSKKDVYDFRLGMAIAWAKLYNISLPELLKPELKVNLLDVKVEETFKSGNQKYVLISRDYDQTEQHFVLTVHNGHDYETLILENDSNLSVIVNK